MSRGELMPKKNELKLRLMCDDLSFFQHVFFTHLQKDEDWRSHVRDALVPAGRVSRIQSHATNAS